MRFHYCDFSRNAAAMGAGVTLLDPATRADFHYCTFWQNAAENNGGAVSVTSATATFQNCSFSENSGMQVRAADGQLGDLASVPA